MELDEKCGRWSAIFPEVPGCATAGNTEEEAIRNAQEALELWFEPVPQTFSPKAKVLELSVA